MRSKRTPVPNRLLRSPSPIDDGIHIRSPQEALAELGLEESATKDEIDAALDNLRRATNDVSSNYSLAEKDPLNFEQCCNTSMRRLLDRWKSIILSCEARPLESIANTGSEADGDESDTMDMYGGNDGDGVESDVELVPAIDGEGNARYNVQRDVEVVSEDDDSYDVTRGMDDSDEDEDSHDSNDEEFDGSEDEVLNYRNNKSLDLRIFEKCREEVEYLRLLSETKRTRQLDEGRICPCWRTMENAVAVGWEHWKDKYSLALIMADKRTT
ncbi:hypothetical protein HDU93_006932, partial [Gonapodya sp. JEL0774]